VDPRMSVRRATINGSTKVWMARVSVNGVRKSRVCRTKAEAVAAERTLAAECAAAAEQAASEDNRPATIRDVLEGYVLTLRQQGKDEAAIRAEVSARAIEATTPALLGRPLAQLAARDFYDFKAARLRDVKATTVNHDLKTLRAALRLVLPDFHLPRGVVTREDETRVRWLSPDQELVLFDAIRSPIREIAKLAALTLMRLSEIRLLRREDVHPGVILLPKAKAGSRAVILSHEAVKILRGQLESHTSEWAFPGPSGKPYTKQYVSRCFKRAARACGLVGFRFHDLRHHGATKAMNSGFAAPIVQALGGWKTERMMRRYAHVTDATLRAAAEAVAANQAWQYPTRPPLA
jgi:integrase